MFMRLTEWESKPHLGKKFNFDTFFVATKANFALCEVPDQAPDFISYSGSTYWDLGDRVRRWSNHWGPKIASCSWYLDLHALNLKYSLCGECLYKDFRYK
jgi:hypothetical protein